MTVPAVFWTKQAACDKRPSSRLVLEALEDRCLLSGGFVVFRLASDVAGLAGVTDRNLVNPWGVTSSPTGPFWFADRGSGVSTLLEGNGQLMSLVVTVPSSARTAGSPTGTVFNGGPGFAVSEAGASAPSRFLFAAEDGTISGWSAVVDPNRALVAVDNSSSGAVYKGLALAANTFGRRFLYAADFSHGTIDVFDQDFHRVLRPGSFQDPDLPDGFAPFNIQNFHNLLFVTYAQQDIDRREDVPGFGHGFIDVYDADGNLIRRLASGGALNSPWGLTLAPSVFGPFGGALLVGNNGDGHINAFDLRSGAFLGDLGGDDGQPLAIPNLWALTFGNDHLGGAADALFFTAGMDDEAHGLFGAIQPSEKRGASIAGPGAFDPHALGEPGDYPLPPSVGPALRVGAGDRPIPIADLLPAKESSLVLVPTLSTVTPPDPRNGTGVPVRAVVDVSSTSSLGTAGGGANAVALNTFLDLGAAHADSQQNGKTQRPSDDLYAAVAHTTSSPTPVARTEVLLMEAYVEEQETPSTDEGGQTAPTSRRVDEVFEAVSPESRPESADDHGVRHGSIETRNTGGRTRLKSLLLLIGIPTIWVYWLRHKARRCSEPISNKRTLAARLRRNDHPLSTGARSSLCAGFADSGSQVSSK